MWLKKYLFLIFATQLAFSQSSKVSIEDKIYNAIDLFVQNPTPSKLKSLSKVELDFYTSQRPKSKAEFLALVILNCNKAYYENQFGFTNNAISSYEIGRAHV